MKKGLSMFLVLTLVFSLLVPFSVSAFETGGDVTGTGLVVSHETHGDTFGGRVPTGNLLDFVIDPLGLLGLGTGGNVDDGTGSADVIFGTEGDVERGVLRAWNTSSVEVVLTVEVELVADAEVAESVAMWVEPSAEVQTAGDTFVGYGQVVVYGTDGVTVSFLLDEVEYEVVVDGTRPVENGLVPTIRRRTDSPDSHGTALRFGGIIDLEAEWTSDVDMSVNASFIMVVASEEAIAAVADDGPYGWLDSFGDYVAPTLGGVPTEVGGSVVVTPVPPTVGFWGDATGFSFVGTTATVNVTEASTGMIAIPFVGATSANTQLLFYPSGSAMAATGNFSVTDSSINIGSNRANTIRGAAPTRKTLRVAGQYFVINFVR